jgi:Holliday junction DNA helicase RuvA
VIGRLEGVLQELAPTRVVIDVAGVGYEVLIPLSTFAELPDPGKSVALHIHTHVRESAIQLFGFHTQAERIAFELLLRASRVGPKLAQTILSGISPAELLEAIRAGNVAVLRAAPGVGSKVAERILVELRDRAQELEVAVAPAPAGGGPAAASAATGQMREQTLSALVNLGYPKAQAERAVEATGAELDPDATLERWVRVSLGRLAR